MASVTTDRATPPSTQRSGTSHRLARRAYARRKCMPLRDGRGPHRVVLGRGRAGPRRGGGSAPSVAYGQVHLLAFPVGVLAAGGLGSAISRPSTARGRRSRAGGLTKAAPATAAAAPVRRRWRPGTGRRA